MSDIARGLFIQNIDPATNCPDEECEFWLPDLVEFCGLLERSPSEESEIEFPLTITESQAVKITLKYGLDFRPRGSLIRLKKRCGDDDLPYKIHTGRELKLMLERKKPLSVFSCSHSFELSQEKLFDTFLDSGLFVKRTFVQIFFPENTIKDAYKHIMYAHKSEEWRIDAYILLLQTAEEMGWNLSL